MRNKTFILVVVLLLSLCFKNVSASELCSLNGYTILTVNGIFTNENGALENKDNLRDHFLPTYNKQSLIFNYLYNPTHLAGVADIIDVVKQGFFDQKSDYDLVEMLNDASQKVTTQKLLLVAHSQGNFYANNFYDKTASQPGGVPSQSVGVYSVATPANHVAGGGKYLTSDTDKIIASLFGGTLKRNIVSPNAHIIFQNEDDKNGHDFSKVYLKYQGDKIVSDIKSSLDKLKNNDEQESGGPCISPPELSAIHKVQGVILASADFAINNTIKAAINTGIAIGNTAIKATNTVASAISSFIKSSGKTMGNLAVNNGAAVILSNNGVSQNNSVANPAKDSSSFGGLFIPQAINKIKTFAMNIFEPNSVSAENISGGGGSISSVGTGPLPSESTPDIIPPVITIIGDNPVEITKDTIYIDAGATSLDDVDGARDVITTGVVDVAVVGTYTITYTATDLSENVATAIRTVNVVALPLAPDITPPVITIIGGNPIEITKDTIYTNASATALDDVDGVRDVVSSGTVDITTIGVYTITYTATDLSGNIATLTRTINVVAPLPPPPPPLNTVTIDKNTTLSPGEYNYDNLIITNNAILTLEGDPTSLNSFKGVKITAVNLTIDPGASISANAKGYGSNQGPGASSDDSVGASYGGFSLNGATHSVTYGSAIKPLDLGSGGAWLSYGGGAIAIVVSDTFTDNGIVSSDGGTSSSGGSIYVNAKNVVGNGILRANGGRLFAANTFKSPGGGGRIAIYYHTSLFNGTMEVKGGCGQYDGMTMSCGQNGTVGVFDESTNDLYLNNSWRFQKNDSPFNFNHIFLTKAQVANDDDVEITANDIVLDKNSTLTLSSSEIINAGILLITGNSIITVIPEKILSLTIPNITIDSGSSISADVKGYISGPGSPSTNYQAGASYGGVGGGATAKPTYGSDIAPVDFGSGTENHRGGGAIRLMVNNNLQNNGIISVNGIAERVSGGSIYVTTKNIIGNGVFQANGGNSHDPYGPIGGAGGRIAVHYQTSSFSGTATALSGVYCYSGCAPAGGAGTIKMIDESIPPPPIFSSAKIITAFNFISLTPNVAGIIDEANHTISLTVPFGTNVTTLVPTITISEKALINPNNNIAQNFTSPVTYVVTAEDNSTQNYIVTVVIAPNPNPGPDITPPSIVSYTFNGVADSITTDPLTNPISFVLTSSEKVNWTSIKIENQNNSDIHKYFYDGVGCVNGTDSCTKTWNGETLGGTLQNGIYKIKVHMKDLAGNDFNNYLSPYVIIVSLPPALE